jgi:hypothetical protein
LDLPPGTGDVQLAVCQELQLSGAVAVTTPSRLASEDTRKGIEMFTSLGVPTLAVVENMSYFTCDGGSKHYPFGRGLSEKLKDSIATSNIIQLPISTLTNDANDSGSPLCITRPCEAAEELSAFEELARVVSKELMLLRYSVAEEAPLIRIDGVKFEVDSLSCSLEKGKDTFVVRLFSESGAKQIRVPASQVRSRDPKSGETLLGKSVANDNAASLKSGMVTVHKANEKNDPTFTPTRVERKGKYGFAIEWGDGATIIYSMQALAKAAAGAK